MIMKERFQYIERKFNLSITQIPRLPYTLLTVLQVTVRKIQSHPVDQIIGGFGSFNPGSSIGIHAQDLLCAMTSMAVRASGSLPLPRNIAHRWTSCTGKSLF